MKKYMNKAMFKDPGVKAEEAGTTETAADGTPPPADAGENVASGEGTE